jgi:hypothetical protein
MFFDIPQNHNPRPPPGPSNSILLSILTEARAGAAIPNSLNPYALRQSAPPSTLQPTHTTGLTNLANILDAATSTSSSTHAQPRHNTTQSTDISLCAANHVRLRLEWTPTDPANDRGTWRLLRCDYRDRTDNGYAAHGRCVEFAVVDRLPALARRVVEDLAWAGARRSPGEARVLREVRVLAVVQTRAWEAERGRDEGESKRDEEERKRGEEERKKAVLEWERERRGRGKEMRRARAAQLRMAREEMVVTSGTKRLVEAEDGEQVAVKRPRMSLDALDARATSRQGRAEAVSSPLPHNNARGEFVETEEKTVPIVERADIAPGSASTSASQKRSAPTSNEVGPPSPKRVKLTSEAYMRVGGVDNNKAKSTVAPYVSSFTSTPPPSSPAPLPHAPTPATSPTSPPPSLVTTGVTIKETKKVRFNTETDVKEYEVVSPVVTPVVSQGESDSSEEDEETDEDSDEESDDGLAALIEQELAALEAEDDDSSDGDKSGDEDEEEIVGAQPKHDGEDEDDDDGGLAALIEEGLAALENEEEETGGKEEIEEAAETEQDGCVEKERDEEDDLDYLFEEAAEAEQDGCGEEEEDDGLDYLFEEATEDGQDECVEEGEEKEGDGDEDDRLDYLFEE